MHKKVTRMTPAPSSGNLNKLLIDITITARLSSDISTVGCLANKVIV